GWSHTQDPALQQGTLGFRTRQEESQVERLGCPFDPVKPGKGTYISQPPSVGGRQRTSQPVRPGVIRYPPAIKFRDQSGLQPIRCWRQSLDFFWKDQINLMTHEHVCRA